MYNVPMMSRSRDYSVKMSVGPFLPRMRKRSLCCRLVSTRLSVRHVRAFYPHH